VAASDLAPSNLACECLLVLRHGANTVSIFNYQTRENHHTQILLGGSFLKDACTPPKLHEPNDSLTLF
jgi:hypothetical protein